MWVFGVEAFVAGAAKKHHVEPFVRCVAIVVSLHKAGLITF